MQVSFPAQPQEVIEVPLTHKLVWVFLVSWKFQKT
jgi:hypothetical protein